MEKDQNLEERNEEVVDSDVDYLAAIKELKANSVDRAKYDKLKEENKKLLDTVINGGEYSGSQEDSSVDLEQLRKNVFDNPEPTNLEYVTNVLKLREALIEEGYEDPFVPQGNQIVANEQDRLLAEKVARELGDMVERANGDSQVFLAEFKRRVKVPTDMTPKRKK